MVINAFNIIPPEFDWRYYSKLDGGAEDLGEEILCLKHFNSKGYKSGIPGSPGCDQGYFIRLIKHLQPNSILEIGPGSSPKIHGENVYYFDVKSRAQLLNRYPGHQDLIPMDIHYVEENGDLSIIDRKFDIVFSCHMIEHAPDLISHLQMVNNILMPRGYYFLIVPDKRYCFDHFKPESTTADILQAYSFGSHGMCSELSFIKPYVLEKLYRTHNDPLRHWNGDHGHPSHDLVGIKKTIGDLSNGNVSKLFKSGFHNWFFYDKNFRSVMKDLRELSEIEFDVSYIYNTCYGSMSFNAILQKK